MTPTAATTLTAGSTPAAVAGAAHLATPAIRSFPAIVVALATADPDRVVFTALDRAGEVTERLTAGQLDRDCRVLAGRLRQVAAAGDRVLVPAMPGLRFHVAFLACLYAGVVAVPVPAIRTGGMRQHPDRRARRFGRLLAVSADCRPVAAIVPGDQVDDLGELAAGLLQMASIRFLAVETPTHGKDSGGGVEPAELVNPSTLAFLQYTSGSTSVPRGVLVSHGAMLANQRLIQRQLDVRPETVVVSWLPTYHDMGLCAGLLQPLFAGAATVLMEPETFLLRPERWLIALSGLADVVTAAPDFAYNLAAARVSAELRSTLDLSGWRVALSGAEPVRAATLRSFAAAFAGCGFRATAATPAYGLAESTLYVCGAAPSAVPTVRRYNRQGLGAGLAVRSDGPDTLELVAVGTPDPEVAVVIADPETTAVLPEGRVGEIWVRSASNGDGYWDAALPSAATFGAELAAPTGQPDADHPGPGRWLRTGDLGFFDDGELLIAGRLKELIIIRGVNYFPHDFERLAQPAHPLLAVGQSAAFTDPARPDRVIVVIETDRGAPPDELAAAAAAGVLAVTDELPVQTEVVLVAAAQIPRTTSGKVRRLDCSRMLADGTLRVMTSSHQRSQQPPRPSSQRAPEQSAGHVR